MLGQISGEFRVVADPTLRFSQSGMAIANVRLVNSSRKKDESGEWRDDKTLWIEGTAFRKTAENVAESLQKGDLVVVIGKAQTEEWEKEGQKHSKITMTIDHIGASLAYKSVTLHEMNTSSSSEPERPTLTSVSAQNDDPPF